MNSFSQDLTQTEDSRVFIMHLLFDRPCEMPEKSVMERYLRKHLGTSVDCIGYDEKVSGFAVKKYKIESKDGTVPPVLNIFGCSDFDASKIDAFTRSQMWDCPDSESILSRCKYQVIVSDMLGSCLDHNDRAEMLMDCLEAVVELYPSCKAVYFYNSGKMFTADQIRNHSYPREHRFIHFAVNVRFFNIEGTNDKLIDSLGMSTVFMPDLQYHFHGEDPNNVVNHAYNILIYMLTNGNPIKDGDTIDGIRKSKLFSAPQWKCRYEESLIQPMREVIDINMGKFAAGNR